MMLMAWSALTMTGLSTITSIGSTCTLSRCSGPPPRTLPSLMRCDLQVTCAVTLLVDGGDAELGTVVIGQLSPDMT